MLKEVVVFVFSFSFFSSTLSVRKPVQHKMVILQISLDWEVEERLSMKGTFKKCLPILKIHLRENT